MIKGYPSSQKGPFNYQTLQPLGSGKHAADSIQRAYSDYAGVDLVPEGTSTGKRIDLAGHSVRANDMIRFVSGPLQGVEVTALSVDANSITLAHDLGTITAADLFRNFRSTTLTVAQNGGIQTSQGPIQFNKDGGVVEVTRDTATPANNAPLPVEIIGAAGQDINITAGDLNVQTSHLGVNFDSQRIGDGTNLLGITGANEARTFDATTHTKQDAAKARLDLLATEVTAAALLAKIIAAPATEAKQDTIITALNEANKPPHNLATFANASVALTTGSDTAVATVPASKVGMEVEISLKNGDMVEVRVGAAVIGHVTSGGGTIKLNNIAAGSVINLRAVADFTATDLVVNLIGKDV